MPEEETNDAVTLAVALATAWLGNPHTRVAADEVPPFLQQMYDTLNALGEPAAPTEEAIAEYTPAVSVRKSLANPEYIISLIDGKPYRSLRRHLTANGLTPEEYRARYGLKPDYPLVAPAYSAARRDTANRLGLGRRPVEVVEQAAETVVKKTRRSAKAALDAAKKALGTSE